MGCEYWGVDFDNVFVLGGSCGYYDAVGSQYVIVVSNLNDKILVQVDVYDNEGKVIYDSF